MDYYTKKHGVDCLKKRKFIIPSIFMVLVNKRTANLLVVEGLPKFNVYASSEPNKYS